MGMGRVQGRGEFQFVCFSNKLWGQELACSCSVILFLSEPAFFFFFLLSIFVFFLPWGLTHPNAFVTKPRGKVKWLFVVYRGLSALYWWETSVGSKWQIHFFCLERLAWSFSGQMHLKDMIERFHLGRFSFTVSRDAFRVPLPGMSSDIKRGMISLDCSLQRKI